MDKLNSTPGQQRSPLPGKGPAKPPAEGFAKLAALGGWILGKPRRPSWTMPDPGAGEDFDAWSRRASRELSAMSAAARRESKAVFSRAELGQAGLRALRGVGAGYAMSVGLVWAGLSKKDSPQIERLFETRAWSVEAWSNGVEAASHEASIDQARANAGAALPSRYPVRLGAEADAGAGFMKLVGAIVVGVVAAPLGWGVAMGAEARLRSLALGRLADGLARASSMMAGGSAAGAAMAEPPSRERAMAGWLGACRWMAAMGEPAHASALAALACRAESSPSRPLGLVRDPQAGWSALSEECSRVEKEADLSEPWACEATIAGTAVWGAKVATASDEAKAAMLGALAAWWRRREGAVGTAAFDFEVIGARGPNFALLAMPTRDAEWVEWATMSWKSASSPEKPDARSALRDWAARVEELAQAQSWPGAMRSKMAGSLCEAAFLLDLFQPEAEALVAESEGPKETGKERCERVAEENKRGRDERLRMLSNPDQGILKAAWAATQSLGIESRALAEALEAAASSGNSPLGRFGGGRGKHPVDGLAARVEGWRVEWEAELLGQAAGAAGSAPQTRRRL